jgi:hypothetical protein
MAHVGLEPSTQNTNPVLGGGTEALYMQDICRRMKPLIEGGGHRCTIFAGDTDANSDGARALIYAGCNLALSVHSDAGYDGSSHWAALCCKQEERSRRWWTTVMETYCASMKLTWNGEQVNGYRNRGYQQRTPGVSGVAVIRIPESVGIPTALIETNWHDRNPDAAAERNENWRQLCAESLARGVLAYLGGGLPPLPPMTRKEQSVMYCPVKDLPRDGDYFAWSIPDMFNSLPQFSAVFPGLSLHNPTPNAADVFVWVTRDDKTLSLVNGPDAQTLGATFKVTLPPWSRRWIEMSQYIGLPSSSSKNYIGGCSLTVKCKQALSAVGGQMAKWK